MIAALLHPAVNVRAPRYLVARAGCACCHCAGKIVAIGIALDAGHRIRVEPGTRRVGGVREDAWHTVRSPAWLFAIEYLPRRVSVRLRMLSAGYRRVESPTFSDRLWLNRCPHCGAVQEDDYLHGEPDVAFMPLTAAAAERIELLAIEAPFAAVIGGTCDDPPLFGAMLRSDRRSE